MFSFSLSHAAADILWEDLDLGSRPFPLEFPYFGDTMDQREGIRRAVHRDLESRGLARRGRVVPEVEEALKLVVRGDYQVDAFAGLDPRNYDHQLLARGGAARDVAALAVMDDRQIKVDLIRAPALLHALVSLVPPAPPGPGHSVTVPLPQQPEAKPVQRREEDYDSATFTRAVASRAGGNPQMRLLESLFSRPRLRVGRYGLAVRGRNGKPVKAPEVSWFDTDQGRYMMQSRPGQDGQRWMTAAPADSGRIAMQLGQDLNFLLNS
ncbi:ESX secretion-associated protein EspG [Actinosynnema pretiosum subsp. pretiosum]